MEEKTARPKARPAGIIHRFAASVYDAAILFGMAFATFIPVVIFEHYIGIVPGWMKTSLLAGLGYAYFVGFWVRSGATTGMRPWRLCIAMVSSGDHPGLAQATWRFFGLTATWACLGVTMFDVFTGHAAGPLFLIASVLPAISLACMALTRQRQALHDILAGTSVFRLQQDPPSQKTGPAAHDAGR